jgi:predicted phosphodiesterase
MEITTVADDLIVAHQGATVHRLTGLQPDTDHQVDGTTARTLPRPAGVLRCRFATVNDVHFGEVECGRIDDHPEGPILRPAPGEPPHPETMNRAAVSEIAAIDPAAVIAKGDLTSDGTPEEFAAFEACYRDRFGQRLYAVRGNHDSYRHQTGYTGHQLIALPGVAVALLDTAIPGSTTGWISDEQLDWLDAIAATSTSPIIVMGHHQQWISGNRSGDYFGLHPDPSDALDALAARRPAVIAYTSGHTHRHRIRSMACGVPSIEIGCVKDFPGTWAEYRVFDGGVMQVVHRISSPEALAWSERCRYLYQDFGIDYQTYAMGTLAERCCTIPLR